MITRKIAFVKLHYITAISIPQHQRDIAASLVHAIYNFTSLGNLSFIRFLAISEPKIFHLDFPGYYTNLPGNIAAAASDERVIRLRWDVARFLASHVENENAEVLPYILPLTNRTEDITTCLAARGPERQRDPAVFGERGDRL